MPTQRVNKSGATNSRRPTKLTDYFLRKTADAAASTRSPSPLSSLSSSPAPGPDRGPGKKDVLAAPAPLSTTRKSSRLSGLKSGDIAISSRPATRSSAFAKPVGKSSTASVSSIPVGTSNLKPNSKPQNEPRATRYRTRQADSNGASSSKRQLPPLTKPRSVSLQVSLAKPPAKRKKPSSCDSDVEGSDDVVHVPRVTLPTPSVMKENFPPAEDDRPSLSPASKKLKLGPARSVLFAPSSLSEEHELTLPPSVKRLPEVEESVRRWRASSISFPVPPPSEIEMEDASAQGDIDDEPMEDAFVLSNRSQPYLESNSRILPTPSPELPTEALSKLMSSAPSSLTPLGTTPVHQSPATPPPSSPLRKSSLSYRPLSPPPSDIPEEPMADAIDDDDDFIARLKAEVKKELAAELPDSDGVSVPADLSDDSSSEDDLCWSPAPTKASTSTSRTTPITMLSNSGRPTRQHKVPAREPFTLTKAPKKTVNPLKELLKQHKKAEKGGYSAKDLRRAEEHINAIKDMKIDDPVEGLLDQDPLSTHTSALKREGSTSALDGQAVLDILGEDEGAMVGQILQNDKRNKVARRREVSSGIEVFDRTEGSLKKGRTSTGGSVKLVTADASDTVFKRFKSVVEGNDVPAVMLMLDHGVLKRIKPSNRGSCLRWLLEQAFSSGDKAMQEAAYHALTALRTDHALPLASFVSTLMTLGAKPDVLKAAGFDVRCPNVQHTRRERESLLEEWLILVERLSHTTFDDVSGMITLLCLIALDRSLTSSSKRLATAAIDAMIERSVSPQMECFVCTSLLKLASDMPTSNKAALVIALGNGSPTIRRISRWLATALIIEGTPIPEDLNTLVPTSIIRGYLESPQAGLMDAQGSEEIDFENVTNKVTLLSVALTDITRQIERETGACTTDPNAISAQLTSLHAKIVDTRAGHLDRSRSKAALQTLSFRVRYQVAAAQDSILHRGKLQAYWAPSNSQ